MAEMGLKGTEISKIRDLGLKWHHFGAPKAFLKLKV